MAGPIARLVANILIMSAGIVSKAFVQAYQQAIVNAKSGKTVTQVVKKNQLQLSQALEILNFPVGARPPMPEVEKKFAKYFEANDPSKGGSFYLQSKIFRAKEAIEKEYEEENKKNQNATSSN